MDSDIRRYLRKIGQKGGRTTLSKYGKATMTKWGCKGGRPRKASK